MKKFKEHTKEKKKEEGSGFAPAPIHFKHFEELVKPTGIVPTAIHFKNILKDKKLNEGKEPQLGDNFKSWMKDRSDNAHLSSKKTTNAANDEIAKKLHSTNNFSNEDLEHIRTYTGGPDDNVNHSQKMNIAMVKNKGKPSREYKKTAEGLSNAINNNRVQHKVTVYSGVSFNPEKHMDKKGRLTSPAFISATHDKQVAAGYAQQKGGAGVLDRAPRHIIKIDLKPGDPATHVGKHSHWDGEHETVVNAGTTLQHHKTTSHWSDGEERWYHIHHMSVAK